MTIDPADAARALDAVGDPGTTALGTDADGTLTLTLPSAGAAMVFAAALAAGRVTDAIDDDEDADAPAAAAAEAAALMAAASTEWQAPVSEDPAGEEPVLVVTFPPGTAPPAAPPGVPARDLAGLALAWAAEALAYTRTAAGNPGFTRWAAAEGTGPLSAAQLGAAETLTRLLAARLLGVPSGELTGLAGPVTAAHVAQLAAADPETRPVLARAPAGWVVQPADIAASRGRYVAADQEQAAEWLAGMTAHGAFTAQACALYAAAVNDALEHEARALGRADAALRADAAAFAFGPSRRGFAMLARLLTEEPARDGR